MQVLAAIIITYLLQKSPLVFLLPLIPAPVSTLLFKIYFKPGMVANTCHLSNMRGINRRIKTQADLSENTRPYLKNN
jgi:hypothetical protein